jgi:hypothetical protein
MRSLERKSEAEKRRRRALLLVGSRSMANNCKWAVERERPPASSRDHSPVPQLLVLQMVSAFRDLTFARRETRRGMRPSTERQPELAVRSWAAPAHKARRVWPNRFLLHRLEYRLAVVRD